MKCQGVDRRRLFNDVVISGTSLTHLRTLTAVQIYRGRPTSKLLQPFVCKRAYILRGTRGKVCIRQHTANSEIGAPTSETAVCFPVPRPHSRNCSHEEAVIRKSLLAVWKSNPRVVRRHRLN